MKVLVAMSGGVDSSVAAKLLLGDGNSCIGCTMKLYNNEDAGISRAHTCCSLDDVEDARSVAYRLGIEHFVFNFSHDFREKIIDKFVDSYCRGLTPNPCIDCNRYMKFDKLFERADILGCDHIATGHYARIEEQGDKYLLKKAVDPAKDQSYVLYSMTQKQLPRTLFPLGGMCKEETRKIAEESGIQMNLEPLNITTDHVGNFLQTTRMAAEITRLIGSPKLKVLYDVYHMQLNEGSICDNIRAYGDQFGHIHVADAPGRHEPGTGEINYRAVYNCLAEAGYRGFIGYELFPKTTTAEAVKAIMAD